MVSVRRVAPVLLLLVTIPVLAADQSSSRPPRELHRVGDHYTAYTPPDPATYAPNAKTHVIKGGDTLWDLAKQYYGNAYLWPQLWETNTWITDAHWIYPGDVLLVEGEASQAATTSTETTATLESGQTATETATQALVATETRRESSPIPLGTESDVYCYGYIGDPNEPMPNRVASFEDVETRYQRGAIRNPAVTAAEGDLVFIDGGSSTGLMAGETYMVVEPGDLIVHPRTKSVIGRHNYYNGQIRVLCTEENRSRAVVTQSCREIHIGARLKPMPQLPIPIARVPELPPFCETPSGRASGYIIDAHEWDLGLAEGNLVQVNLGRDDQVQPGDFLTVFRASPIAGQPRQILGEIGILTTESRTATGRIMASRRTIQVGDSVEIR